MAKKPAEKSLDSQTSGKAKSKKATPKVLIMDELDDPMKRELKNEEQYVCPGCMKRVHPLPPCPYCMTPAQVHIFPQKWAKFTEFLAKSPKNYVKLYSPDGKAISFKLIDEKSQKKELRATLGGK